MLSCKNFGVRAAWVLAVVATVMFSGANAFGLAYLWNQGSGTDWLWENPANWGVVAGYPGSAADDTAQFDGTAAGPIDGTNTALALPGTYSFGDFAFSDGGSGYGDYTFSNATFTLGALTPMITQGGGTNTFDATVAFSQAANLTLQVSGGQLTLNGAINETVAGKKVVITTDGVTAGTVTLGGTAGATAFSGGVSVSAATLQVSADANLGASAGGIELKDAATLRLNTTAAAFTSARAVTIGDGGGKLAVTGLSGATLSGPVTTSGTGTITAAAMASPLTLSGQVTTANAISVENGANLRLTNVASATPNSISQINVATGGTVYGKSTQGVSSFGTGRIALNGGTLSVDGGTAQGLRFTGGITENFYRHSVAENGVYLLQAIDQDNGANPDGLLTRAPLATGSLTGNIQYADGTIPTKALTYNPNFNNPPLAGGVNDYYDGTWKGKITVDVAGWYTFTTGSDDGSVVYIDLDKNGLFNTAQWSTGTPTGELIVNNNYDQGTTYRATSVQLAPGVYDYVIGFREGTGGNNMYALATVGNLIASPNANPGSTAAYTYVSPTTVLNLTLGEFTANAVDLNQDSTIQANNASSANFGTLTFASGKTLTTSGTAPITFLSTSVADVASFNTGVNTSVGKIIDGGAFTKISKVGGTAHLIFSDTQAGSALTAGKIIEIQQGPVAVVGTPGANNPAGAATISVPAAGASNPQLVLSNNSGATPYAFDNPVAIDDNASVVAKAVGTGVARGTINLGGANPFTVAAGKTVTFGTANAYTLNLARPITPAVAGQAFTVGVQAGSLVKLGASNMIDDVATLDVGRGGGFDLNGNTETVNTLRIQGAGAVYGSSGSISATTYDFQPGAAMEANFVSAGFTKSTAGSLALGGNNTGITGPISVTGGILRTSRDVNLGPLTNAFSVSAGGTWQTTQGMTIARTGRYTLSNGILDVPRNPFNYAGNQYTPQSGGWDVNFTSVVSDAKLVVGAGTTLTKTGQGTFSILGNQPDFQGTLVLGVDAGTIDLVYGPGGHNISPFDMGRLNNIQGVEVNQGSFFALKQVGVVNGSANITTDATVQGYGALSNTAPVKLFGGTLWIAPPYNSLGGNRVFTETIGPLTIGQGYDVIRVDTTGSNNVIYALNSPTSPAGLNRALGGAVLFSGIALGQNPTNNSVNISWNGTTGPTLSNGMIGGWALYTTDGAAGNTDFAAYDPANYATTALSRGVIRLATAGRATAVIGAASSANVDHAAGTENLTADAYINSLRTTGAVNIGASTAGVTLRVGSGGILVSDNSALAIGTLGTTSWLSAGTSASAAELFFHTPNAGTVTVYAGIANNASGGAVTVVRDGTGTVNLYGAGTYSGGTILNGGTTATGSGAADTYLGTGPVTVQQGATLNLGRAGATSYNNGGAFGLPAYTVINESTVSVPLIVASGDTFSIGAGSVITGTNRQGGGLQALSRVANNAAIAAAGHTVLAADAIVAHTEFGGDATNGTTGYTISNLGTAADVYFGLGADFNVAGQSLTIGAGTPWKGVSTDLAADRRFGQGTLNIAAGTTDFNLQGASFMAANGAFSVVNNAAGTGSGTRHLYLGNGGTGMAINGVTTPMVAHVLGTVGLDSTVSSFSDNLTFSVEPGATLYLSQANAMGGSGTSNAGTIASIVVADGGRAWMGNQAAVNGPIVVQSGGVFYTNQGGFAGSGGTVTMQPGSILQLGAAAALTNASALNVSAPGIIYRLNASGITNLDTVPNPNSIFELYNTDFNLPNPTTFTAFNANGLTITNDNRSRSWNNNLNTYFNVGPNGLTLAPNSGLYWNGNNGMRMNEDIEFQANTVTIGSTGTFDGLPGLGMVTFTGWSNRGLKNSVMNVIGVGTGANAYGAGIQMASYQFMPNTALNMAEGTRFDLTNQNPVFGSLNGAGVVYTSTQDGNNNRTLTVGWNDLSTTFSGQLQATFTVRNNQNGFSLTKVGKGVMTITSDTTTASFDPSVASASLLNYQNTLQIFGTTTGGGITLANDGLIRFAGQNQGTIGATGGANYVYQGGVLTLDNTAKIVADRIGGRHLYLRGGELSVLGKNDQQTAATMTNSTLYTEWGHGTVRLTPGSTGSPALTTKFAGLTRNVYGTLSIIAPFGTSQLQFTNRPGQTGSGTFTNGSNARAIMPWAYMQDTSGVTRFAVPDGTADPYFVRPLGQGTATPEWDTTLAVDNNRNFDLSTVATVNQSYYYGWYNGGQANSLMLHAGSGLALGSWQLMNLQSGGLIADGNGTITIGPAGTNFAGSNTFFGAQNDNMFFNVVGSTTLNMASNIVGRHDQAVDFYKNGDGTLNLQARMVLGHAPRSIVMNAGTIKNSYGNNVMMPFPTQAQTLVMNGGTFDLNGYDQIVRNLRSLNIVPKELGGVYGTIKSNAARTATFLAANDNTDCTFNGVFEGNINLVKTGNNDWYNWLRFVSDQPLLTGTVTLNSGYLQLRDFATMKNIQSMNIDFARLYLDDSGLVSSINNRLGNAPVNMYGGELYYQSSVTDSVGATSPTITDNVSVQNIGTLTLKGAQPFIYPVISGGSPNGAKIVINSLVRLPGTNVAFQGTNLGTAGGANSFVVINSLTTPEKNGGAAAPVSLVNGIIGGWATAWNGTIEDFVKYDATLGVQYLGLAGRPNTIVGGTPTQNVYVDATAAVTQTLAANSDINSLAVRVNGQNVKLDLNGYRLTIGTGGLIAYGNNATGAPFTVGGSTDATRGTLTAGTDANPAELHIMTAGVGNNSVTVQNNGWTPPTLNSWTNITANIRDNSNGGPVTLIKDNGTQNQGAQNNLGGTLILSGMNTYTGKTYLRGNVQLNAPASGTLDGNPANLGVNYYAIPGDLVINGSSFNSAGYNGQIDYAVRFAAGAPAGQINPAANLTINGRGMLIFNGNATSGYDNTIKSITINSNGEGSANADQQRVFVQTSGTPGFGKLTLTEGITVNMTYAGTDPQINGLLELPAGMHTITVNEGAINQMRRFEITAGIQGEGGIIKDGDGTLFLSGPNSFTGGITVNNGILAAGGRFTGTNNPNWGLPTTGAVTLNANGILDLALPYYYGYGGGNWNGYTALYIGKLQGSGTVQVSSGGNDDNGYYALAVGNGDVSSTFSGRFLVPDWGQRGTWGVLEKVGTGTFTYDGTGSNWYGRTNMNGGEMIVTGNATLNFGIDSNNRQSVNERSGYFLNTGGKLTLDNSTTVVNNRLSGNGLATATSGTNDVYFRGGELQLIGQDGVSVEENIKNVWNYYGSSKLTLKPGVGASAIVRAVNQLSDPNTGANGFIYVKGPNLGKAPAVGTTTSNFVMVNNVRLWGGGVNNVIGLPGVSIVPSMIGDDGPADGSAPNPGILTQDPAGTAGVLGVRRLTANEYINAIADQCNVLLSAPTAPYNAAIQSLTLGQNGSVSALTNAATLQLTDFRIRRNLIYVQPGVTNASIEALRMYRDNDTSFYIYNEGDLTVKMAAGWERGFNKSGAGKLTLYGATNNGYNVQINDGAVELNAYPGGPANNILFGRTNFGYGGFNLVRENLAELWLNSGSLDLKGNNQFASGFGSLNPYQGGTLKNTSATPAKFTISNGWDPTGGLTNQGVFGGSITGNISIEKWAGGNLVLTGPNDYTGATTLNGYQLTLRDSGTMTGTSSITLNQGNFNVDNRWSKALSPRLPSTTPAPMTMWGGRFNLYGGGSALQNTSEALGQVTLVAGSENWITSGPLGTGRADINIASMVRQPFSTAFFQAYNSEGSMQQASGSGYVAYASVSGVMGRDGAGNPRVTFTTAPTLTNNIIGGWAFVSGNTGNYGNVNGQLTVELATYVPGKGITYLGNTADGAPDYNQKVTASPWTPVNATDNVYIDNLGVTLAAGDRTINSLTYRSQGQTLTFSANTQILDLASGALVFKRYWDNNLTIGASAGQGVLTAGTAANSVNELVVYGSGGDIYINSVIADNVAAGNRSINLVKAGPGNLYLRNNTATLNSYTGKTYVNAGILVLDNSAGALDTQWAVPGDVVITGSGSNESILQFNRAYQLKSTATVTINPYGRINPNGQNFALKNLIMNNTGSQIPYIGNVGNNTVMKLYGDITVNETRLDAAARIQGSSAADYLDLQPGWHYLNVAHAANAYTTWDLRFDDNGDGANLAIKSSGNNGYLMQRGGSGLNGGIGDTGRGNVRYTGVVTLPKDPVTGASFIVDSSAGNAEFRNTATFAGNVISNAPALLRFCQIGNAADAVFSGRLAMTAEGGYLQINNSNQIWPRMANGTLVTAAASPAGVEVANGAVFDTWLDLNAGATTINQKFTMTGGASTLPGRLYLRRGNGGTAPVVTLPNVTLNSGAILAMYAENDVLQPSFTLAGDATVLGINGPRGGYNYNTFALGGTSNFNMGNVVSNTPGTARAFQIGGTGPTDNNAYVPGTVGQTDPLYQTHFQLNTTLYGTMSADINPVKIGNALLTIDAGATENFTNVEINGHTTSTGTGINTNKTSLTIGGNLAVNGPWFQQGGKAYMLGGLLTVGQKGVLGLSNTSWTDNAGGTTFFDRTTLYNYAATPANLANNNGVYNYTNPIVNNGVVASSGGDVRLVSPIFAGTGSWSSNNWLYLYGSFEDLGGVATVLNVGYNPAAYNQGYGSWVRPFADTTATSLALNHTGGTNVNSGYLSLAAPGTLAGPITTNTKGPYVNNNQATIGTLYIQPGAGKTITFTGSEDVVNDGRIQVNSGIADMSGHTITTTQFGGGIQPFSDFTVKWLKPGAVGYNYVAAPTQISYGTSGGGDEFLNFYDGAGNLRPNTFLNPSNPGGGNTATTTLTAGQTLNYGNAALINTASGLFFNPTAGGNATDCDAAVWSGTFTVGTTGGFPVGPLTFGLNSDDGSQIWIDKQLVVDFRGTHGYNGNGGIDNTVGPKTATITLAAGVHTIDIGWYNGAGGQGIEARVGIGSNLPYAMMSYIGPNATVAGLGMMQLDDNTRLNVAGFSTSLLTLAAGGNGAVINVTDAPGRGPVTDQIGNINITGAGVHTLNLGANHNLLIAGAMTYPGGGSLVINSTGSVTVTGNSPTIGAGVGGLTISSGTTMTVVAGAALGPGTKLTNNNVVNFLNSAQTLNGLSGSATAVTTLNNTALTVGSGVYNGVINGTGSLTKNTGGALTLGQTPGWVGPLTFNAGTLTLAFPGQVPPGQSTINTNCTLNLSPGAGNTLNFPAGTTEVKANGTLQVSSGLSDLSAVTITTDVLLPTITNGVLSGKKFSPGGNAYLDFINGQDALSNPGYGGRALLEGPVLISQVLNIASNVGWASVFPATQPGNNDPNNFHTLFEGYFTPSQTGNYRFQDSADDGAVFAIDLNNNGSFRDAGESHAPAWGPTELAPAGTGVALTAGVPYHVVMGNQEGGGGDWAWFQIMRPGGAWTNITPGDGITAGNGGTWSAMSAPGTINVSTGGELRLKQFTIGAVTLNGGILTLPDAAAATPSTTNSLTTGANSGSVLNLGANTGLTVNNSVSFGGGSMTVNGGPLNINGPGSGNGALTVGATGTVVVAAAASLPSGTALTNNNVVTFNNPAQSLASLAGSGATHLDGPTALTVAGGTYGGSLDGAGSVTVNTTTSMTMTALPAHTGGTTVNSGKLVLQPAASGSLPATGTTTVNAAGTLQFAATGGSTITAPGTAPVNNNGKIHVSSGVADLSTRTITNLPLGFALGTMQEAILAPNTIGGAHAWDLTTVPTNWTTQSYVRGGYINNAAPWVNGGSADNTTLVYAGEFYWPGSATNIVSFAEQIDDNTRLLIDGSQWINDTAWNVAVKSTQALTVGWHTFEIRFGNGGGGYGPSGVNGNPAGGANWSATFGFGIDPQGRDSYNAANYMRFDAATTGNNAGAYGYDDGTGMKYLQFRTPGGGQIVVDPGATFIAGRVLDGIVTLNGAASPNLATFKLADAAAAAPSNVDSLTAAAGTVIVDTGANTSLTATTLGISAGATLNKLGAGDLVFGTGAGTINATGILNINGGRVLAPSGAGTLEGGTINVNAGGTLSGNGAASTIGSDAVPTTIAVGTGGMLAGGNTAGVAGETLTLNTATVTINGSGGVFAKMGTIGGVTNMSDVVSIGSALGLGGTLDLTNANPVLIVNDLGGADKVTNGVYTFMNWLGADPTVQPAWSVASGTGQDVKDWNVDLNGAQPWDTGSNWTGDEGVAGTVFYPGQLRPDLTDGPNPAGSMSLMLEVTGTGFLAPGALSAATIAPIAGATNDVIVTGPATAGAVKSLTIAGAAPLTASLSLQSGSLAVVEGTTINAGGSLTTGDLGATGGFSTATLAMNGNAAMTVGAGTTAAVNAIDPVGGVAANVGGSANLQVAGTLDVPNGTLATAGTVNFQAGSAGTVKTLKVTGGATNLDGAQAVATGNFSGGQVLMTGGSVGTANVSGTGDFRPSGGNVTTLGLTGGIAKISGAATVNTATLNGDAEISGGTVNNATVSGGTATISGGSVPRATLSGGTTTLSSAIGSVTLTSNSATLKVSGAAATTDSVAGMSGALDTQGNNLTVNNTLITPGITVSNVSGAGTWFQVKGAGGTNVLNDANDRVLTLNGVGTVQIAALGPGLDVRGWKNLSPGNFNANAGSALDGAMFDRTAPTPAPNDSTPGMGGANQTLPFMTNAIHWGSLAANQEWAANGGLPGNPATPTAYMEGYDVEYRGKLLITTPGNYSFATTSDDGTALWIDAGTPNPTYAQAKVQNNFAQGMTLRSTAAPVALTAGYHDIILRFNQGTGGHGVYLQWDPNGGAAWADIPGNLFFHGQGSSSALNLPKTHITVNGNPAGATLDLADATQDHVLGDLKLNDGANLGIQNAATVSFNDITNLTGAGSATVGSGQAIKIQLRGSLAPAGLLTFGEDLWLNAGSSATFNLTVPPEDLTYEQVNMGLNGLKFFSGVGNLNVLFPNGATGIGEGEYDLFNGIYTSYLDTGPYDPGTQQHGPYVFANSTIPTDTLNAPPGYKWFDYDPATPDIQWISYDNIAGKVSVKLISTTPAGTDGYWTNGTGSGMWSNAGNWDSNPNVPSLARDTARFVVKYPNGDPASPAIGTVNLNADSTVGKMYFDATAYTIMSPAGKTLTLDNGANPAEIHIADGSHEILAKVNLATNLTIWPATGTTLTLTDIDETPAGSGKGITVDDTGKVVLNGIGSFGGGITVNKGEVELGNFQSLAVGAPITIGAQGQVSLRVDMTVAGAAGAVQRAAVSAPSVNAVPEPGTLVLLAAGALIALAVGLRRKLGR